MLSSDIIFSPGTHYVLAFDTNKYAGNFERELASYVCGAYDEERGHGGVEYEQYRDACEEDEGLETIGDCMTSHTHDEYDRVSNTIWPTPLKYLEDKTGWTPPQSVAVFPDRKLTATEMTKITARAQEYCSENGIVLFGVRLLEVQHQPVVTLIHEEENRQ